ncbi:molybdopterin synthase subunit MoaD (EC 2.8.1.12) [Streptoalloteichus tenebrarius]|uniref:Molybdopterin synthase subunit MoaD n=1 Tax=Streptoalloteichus tenebrarius (strain ATCC 17920 / DSM 40477 / JCM 4838 / CBS 697.72 / NBRC 16177 / NCIMB 11028 / NRRL B-12390 / A12253. 1 / ISP 5477) TaxID=1933 RepID=A0ABT1HYU3_STRSD|nr:ubiquitin-like small modifier protein 1 [Streptoalloteichus tenebrarius]MCP2260699.1 molybdopterin synthase subunit MoaD (EC 2.8.1.12) [Streptoalloteichus tenebrarius]BFF03768.1 MoaD/ThiS family protein [Streptoalloteichus tenebrarius]
MRVVVVLSGVLRPSADGAARLEVDAADGATLDAVLDQLAARHPALDRRLRDERGDLRRYVNFYLDGEECRRLDGAATRLAEGAEIQIIPSVAGG